MIRSRLSTLAGALAALTLCAAPLLAQPDHASGPDRRSSRAADVARNPAQPPPGPIAPTDRIRLHKDTITLPFVIDQPGSYVLTSDLTGVPGEHGIIIAASDVTIDLNGFTLRGVEGSGDGIHVLPPRRSNATVFNGIVKGWGETGVQLWPGDSATVRNVHATENRFGINTPDNSIIVGCHASMNTDNGIATDPGSLIEDCVADSNGSGIAAHDQTIVRNCIATNNLGNGIFAITNAQIENCVTSFNGLHGIAGQNFVRIADCVAKQNVKFGFRLGHGSTLTGSLAMLNEIGVSASHSVTVSECKLALNGTGIRMGRRSALRESEMLGNDQRPVPPGTPQNTFEDECILEGNVFRADFYGFQPGLLLRMGARGQFRGNDVGNGQVEIESGVVTNNTISAMTEIDATGPGVAPIVDSIAEAGPYDNIRLPN